MTTSLNRLLAIVFVCGLCLGFSPVEAFSQNSPSQFRPIAPENLGDVDPKEVSAAMKLLEEAQQAFREAPAITSVSELVVNTGDQTRELVVSAKFGPDGQTFLETPDSLVVAKDGWLNVVNYNIYDRYLRVQMSGTVPQEFDSIYSDKYMAGFEVLMRDGEPSEVWLEAIMMRSIGVPAVTGLKDVTDDKGRQLKQISLAGRMGSGSLDYDPESRKIVRARSSMYPIDVQGAQQAGSFSWEMNLNINATFLKELPEPIVFDPGKRLGVGSLREVDPVKRNKLVVGNPSPTLTAKQMDGSDIDFSTFKGKIVVIDFWATWCAPCKRGLPKLNELFMKNGRNDEDVLVYAVSIMETPPKAEGKIEKVREYWSKQDFAVPTVVCVDDEIPRKWGITSIPKLVILDQEGKVAEVINGYQSDLEKKIQAKIKSLQVAE